MDLLSYMCSVEHILRMSIELFLAVCIKLLCDNGRIHWRDFVNDFVCIFSPNQQPGDGLSREIVMSRPQMSSNVVDDFMAQRDSKLHERHTQSLARNAFVISIICFVMFAIGSLVILL